MPDHDFFTRQAVLAAVRAALPADGVGAFCYVCGAAGVATEEAAEGEIFVCQAAGHRSPRAFLFDGRAVFWFEGDRLVHEGAGAIVRRTASDERQTLLFLRQKYPYLYTIPAGHVEIGRDPEAEMRREVAEETGLTVVTALPLWPGETLTLQGDGCRRGADVHRWHVYEVTADGLARLSDEGRLIGWYRDAEIRALASQGLLTMPTHVFLARLGIVAPYPAPGSAP